MKTTIPATKQTITLIDEDRYSPSSMAFLFEVKDEASHYYVAYTGNMHDGRVDMPVDFSPLRNPLIKRKDMTDKEYEIAKELFFFLWESDNGTNTCESYEWLEDVGISEDDVRAFIDKFDLHDCLDAYENNDPEDDGVEIYWDFLCSFDIDDCKFFDYNEDDTAHEDDDDEDDDDEIEYSCHEDAGDYEIFIKREYEVISERYMTYEEAKERLEQLKNSILAKDENDELYQDNADTRELMLLDHTTGDRYVVQL